MGQIVFEERSPDPAILQILDWGAAGVLEFEDGTLLEASTEVYIRDGLLQWPEVSYTAFTCFRGFTVFYVSSWITCVSYDCRSCTWNLTWRMAHYDRRIISGSVKAVPYERNCPINSFPIVLQKRRCWTFKLEACFEKPVIGLRSAQVKTSLKGTRETIDREASDCTFYMAAANRSIVFNGLSLVLFKF